MKRNLIFLDEENPKYAIDLLAVANRMYADETFESHVVSRAVHKKQVEGIFDHLILIPDHFDLQHDVRLSTDMMEALQQQYHFDSILIPATFYGRMLAPRLAMRLHTGLVADVTDIHVAKSVIEMVRPAFSGKIMAGIVKQGEGPIMMSVRPNVFSYANLEKKQSNISEFAYKQTHYNEIQLISTDVKSISYDICDSDILVSGGGGVVKKFQKIEKLAESLQGHVSASRKIVDQGLATRSIQVGQSGKTVSPKLYIALGIDGAIQHIEGLKNVEHIISVNVNRNAPICSLSDIVVEGDAAEFVDRLIERIERK